MIRRLGVIALCALVLPASAQAWTWPVDGPVLRPFSFDRAHPYAAGQHRGVDLGAPTGTNVLAPSHGVVTFAGTVPTGGKTVSIETQLGYTATLVHLGSIAVQRGAAVTEGGVVGTVGPSGVADSAEPYVYFGLRRTGQEQGYVDPLVFLPPRQVAAAPTPARQPDSVPAQAAPGAAPAAAAAATPTSSAAAAAPAAPVEPAAAAAGEPLVVSAAGPSRARAKAERPSSERVRRPPVTRAAAVRRRALPHEDVRSRPAGQTAHAPRRDRVPRAEAPRAVPAAPTQAVRSAAAHARGTSRWNWWILGLVITALTACTCLWRVAKWLDA